jgi:hypothetical protein
MGTFGQDVSYSLRSIGSSRSSFSTAAWKRTRSRLANHDHSWIFPKLGIALRRVLTDERG